MFSCYNVYIFCYFKYKRFIFVITVYILENYVQAFPLIMVLKIKISCVKIM